MDEPQNYVNENCTSDQNRDNKKARGSWKESVLLYLHDFAYLLTAILVILLLLFRVVIVDGPSMENTLKHGDYLLLLSNVFYQDPQVGDIVVLSKESFKDGEPIIKRVIATEGQKVAIDFTTGIVYVDDVALDEPYTKTPTTLTGNMPEYVIVDEGCVFVMGDNRNNSRDSRFSDIGMVDRREIIGKALLICFPGGGMNGNEQDFSRIGVIS